MGTHAAARHGPARPRCGLSHILDGHGRLLAHVEVTYHGKPDSKCLILCHKSLKPPNDTVCQRGTVIGGTTQRMLNDVRVYPSALTVG
jgi:hypothetical protein